MFLSLTSLGESCAGEQFREHKGSLRKMYEQFVEHNHQIESRIEAKFKRIPDAERRINACAQKRAMDSNLEVVGKGCKQDIPKHVHE